MMSYLFNGQWPTDKIERRKYTHMSIILFTVCAYVAIYYKERQQMDDSIIKKEDD